MKPRENGSRTSPRTDTIASRSTSSDKPQVASQNGHNRGVVCRARMLISSWAQSLAKADPTRIVSRLSLASDKEHGNYPAGKVMELIRFRGGFTASDSHRQ